MMNRTACKTHGMYDDKGDGCPICRINELQAQLDAVREYAKKEGAYLTGAGVIILLDSLNRRR